MSLSEDIIAACADDHTPLATILRKCVILAAQLKSEELRGWALKELEGYEEPDEVPGYRVLGITAKGLFLGGWGAQINDQPLPSSVLEEEHRHWATMSHTMQGVSALEALVAKDPTGSARVNWPADMVAYYQSEFMHRYSLNRAWQEIPIPSVIDILDTIRTKVLRFVLKLQEELGDIDRLVASRKVEDVATVVQTAFYTNVYGGTAIIASETADVDARTQTVVVQGDFDALVRSLQVKGLGDSEVKSLQQAMVQDSHVEELSNKGNVKKWIAGAAKKTASATGGVAVDVAKASLTALVSSYLGLPPPG